MAQQFITEDQLFGPPAAPPQQFITEDDLFGEEHDAHQPITDANALAAVDQSRAQVVPPRLGAVAVGLSKWDDWTHNLSEYGLKRREGADVLDTLVNTTDQEALESVHRYATTIGETFDASVLKGDRGKDVLKTARERFLTFMTETGWSDAATAEEGRAVLKMFLFDEYHGRVARSPERLRYIADTTYQTVLEEARADVMAQPNDPAAKGLLDSLAVLTRASPDERRDLIVDSLRSGRGFWPLPRNDLEETVFNEVSEKQFGKGRWNERYDERLQELARTMGEVLGTSDARPVLANRFSETQRIFNYQDSGFIAGDIVKRGVLAVDPKAPGGFTPIMLMPDEVVTRIERRVRERGVRVPGVLPIDEATVKNFQERYGADWNAAFNEQYNDQREARRRAASQAFDRHPESERLNPVVRKNLSAPVRGLLDLSSTIDNVVGNLQSVWDEILNAPNDVPVIGPRLSAAQKQWVLALTQNPDLAKNTENFTDALRTSFDILTESGDLLDRMLGSVRGGPEAAAEVTRKAGIALRQQQTRARFPNFSIDESQAPQVRAPGRIVRPAGGDVEALSALDPGTLAEAFSFFNRAPELLAQAREDVDKEQQARNARMAAVQAGKSQVDLAYFKDVAGTMWYQMGSAFQTAFADVIDRPQDAALLLGGEVAGDMSVRALSQARSGLFRGMARTMALKRAGQQMAVEAPALARTVIRNLNDRIRGEGFAPDAKDALRTALADMRAGLKEVTEARIAGAELPGGGVSRFAWAMSKALKHVDDLLPNGQVSALLEASPLYKQSTLGWRKAVEFVRDWRGRLPRNFSLQERNVAANAGRNELLRITNHILNNNPAEVDLTAARGRLEDALQRGDPAEIAAATDTVTKLVADRSIPDSPAESFKAVAEIDELEAEMAQIQSRISGRARGEVDQDAATRIKRDEERLEQVRARHSELRDRVGIRPMEDADLAQLLVWQDTGKLGYGPWATFRNGLHHTIARLQGGSADSLKQAMTTAERVYNFFDNQASNYRITKVRQAYQKERLNLLYRRGRELSTQLKEEIDAELGYAKARLEQDRPHITDPQELQLRQFEVDELQGRRQLIYDDDQALAGEHRRMLNNPVDKRWVLNNEKILTARFFRDRDIVQLVESNPEWFEHFDTSRFFRRGELPNDAKARHDRLIDRAERLEAEAKALDKPAPRPAADPDAPTATELSIADDPQVRRALRAAQKQAEAATLRRDARDIDNRLRSWEPVQSEVARLRRLLTIDSADDALQQGLADMADVQQAAGAAAYLQNGGDAWLSSVMPLHLKSRAIEGAARATRNNMAMKNQIPEALAAELNSMSPEVRALTTTALRTGRTAKQLLDERPDIAAKIEQLHPSGRATIESNVDNYLRHESDLQAELIEQGREAGLITDAEYRNFRRQGYDPHLYGLYRIPDVVNTTDVAELRRTFSGQTVPGSTSGAIDGAELMFQRDLQKYRVFSREADGFIYDAQFPSEREARRYIARQFGKNVKFKRDGKFLRGKTTAGDEVVIGDPIGDAEIPLDFNKETTLERRLDRFATFNRDIAMHRFLSSVKEVGGMVLDDAEFTDLSVRSGKDRTYFQRQYIRLPNQPRRFGTMAGKMVHRKVLSEMNQAAYGHDQLTAWIRGVQELLLENGNAWEKLAGKVRPLTERVNQAAKASLILMSPKTWMANVTFNIMTNEFTGGHVMRAANFPNLGKAIRQVIGDPARRLRETPADLQDFLDATRHGILNGSIFGQGSEHLQRAMVRAFDLDNLPALQKKLAKYTQLEQEAADIIKAGKPRTERMNQIELAKTAIEGALKNAEMSGLRKLAREVWGVWFQNKTPTGLPSSLSGKKLRDLYGNIDDVWRYATFLNLRKEGKSAVEAADIVKRFMQNYGDLPSSVTRMSKNPLGALVTAFPYELGRLTFNWLRYKPLTFMALTSVVPAVNLFGAFMAGVPLERAAAGMRAMGNQTSASMVEEFVTSVVLWDPVTHDAVDQVKLHNSVLPLASVVSQYGPIAQAADTHFGGDTLHETGIRAGAKALQAFVLNNPVVNTVFGVLSNKDPVTGQTLFNPKTARLKDHAGGFMRLLGRSIVPPWTPSVGRFPTAVRESQETALHPLTGRPYKGEEVGTPLTRELINLPARGRLADQFARLFGKEPKAGKKNIVNDELLLMSLMFQAQNEVNGRDYGRGLPLFSLDKDRRVLAARMVDESFTPEERAAAEAELKALVDVEMEYHVNGRKFTRGKTEEELDRYMRAVKERGSLEHFANGLDLHEKALLVANAEQVGVSQRTLKEWVEGVRTTGIRPANKAGRPSIPRDPGKLVAAKELLSSWLADPRSGDAAKLMYDWLLNVQSVSFKRQERRRIREAAVEKLRQEGKIR